MARLQRNGTTTLFAALALKTGKSSANACRPSRQEFISFLKKSIPPSDRCAPLHIIVDNYSTDKTKQVRTVEAAQALQSSLHSDFFVLASFG